MSGLIELKETITYVYWFIDGYDKDTDEQPDEERYRVRSGSVCPEYRASATKESGCISSLAAQYYWDYMEAPSCRYDQLLTPFPALLPSLNDGGGGRAEKFMFLTRAWPFSLPDPIKEPPRSPLEVTSLEQKIFLVLLPFRSLQGFRNHVSGAGSKTNY